MSVCPSVVRPSVCLCVCTFTSQSEGVSEVVKEVVERYVQTSRYDSRARNVTSQTETDFLLQRINRLSRLRYLQQTDQPQLNTSTHQHTISAKSL